MSFIGNITLFLQRWWFIYLSVIWFSNTHSRSWDDHVFKCGSRWQQVNCGFPPSVKGVIPQVNSALGFPKVSPVHVWHPLSRKLGSEPKELYLICWWRRRTCYGFTSPHGSESLDYNKYGWRRSPSILLCCFPSIEHASTRRQAFVWTLRAPNLGLNCDSSVSDR